jgi:hypothetical protein
MTGLDHVTVYTCRASFKFFSSRLFTSIFRLSRAFGDRSKMVNKTYPSSSYMQAHTYAEASADRPLMGKVVKWKWGESKSPRNIIDAVVNELNGQGRKNHP